MDKKIKILMLEDAATDAELEIRELEKAGINFESKVVNNQADFEKAVVEYSPDIVIADYSLPQYHGLMGLFYMQSVKINVPFIMLSGTVPHDLNEILGKSGVTALVVKSELSKLPETVRKALSKNDNKNE